MTLSVLSSPVQQPDPNQPRPEGAEMMPVRGEALGVVTNWPPSLEAALQRWGTISPKAPCLTSLDTAGKPLYVLTYGNQTLLQLRQSFTVFHCAAVKLDNKVYSAVETTHFIYFLCVNRSHN